MGEIGKAFKWGVGLGFGLLVVLGIVIFLFVSAVGVGTYVVVSGIPANVQEARQDAAEAYFNLFETTLDLYKLDTGRYPTSEQGLQSLREKPKGVEKWDGPYLPKPLSPDPWGNPYVYELVNEDEYIIASFGAGGIKGGEGENGDMYFKKKRSPTFFQRIKGLFAG